MADDAAPREAPATDHALSGGADGGSTTRTLITEAAYIALATATAYATAYTFEAGFCVNFRLPVELIELETGMLVQSATFVGLVECAAIVSVFGVVKTTWFATGTTRVADRENLVILGSIAGKVVANNQKDFYVMAGTPEIVVLRIYGDRAIGAQFSRKKATVSRELRIRTIGAEARMRLERIGPLRLE